MHIITTAELNISVSYISKLHTRVGCRIIRWFSFDFYRSILLCYRKIKIKKERKIQ